MKIDVQVLGKVCLVAPQGNIKLGETDLALRETINSQIEKGHNRLVLDLAGVRYMDSAGIGEVVAALKRVRQNGGDMKVAGLNEHLLDLFTLTKLMLVFEVHKSAEEAIASYV